MADRAIAREAVKPESIEVNGVRFTAAEVLVVKIRREGVTITIQRNDPEPGQIGFK